MRDGYSFDREESTCASADCQQQLNIIFQIARILVSKRNLDEMLPTLLSCLIGSLNAATAGAILVHEPANGTWTIRAAEGYPLSGTPEQLDPDTRDRLMALAGSVGQDVSRAPRIVVQKEIERAGITTSALPGFYNAVSIPLATNGKVLGLLVLEGWNQSYRFREEDLPFLQAVGGLIALSIEAGRLAQELHDSQALAEANRLKAEVISILAHEMRTPLTTIKGYSTALLMEDVEFSPETQREFLRLIDEECDVLEDLIRDLLESSIIDAGLLRLEYQPVLLPRLVREVVDDFAKRTAKHQFIVDFPSSFPVIDADPQRVAQVLRNLLDNAMKYSPSGGAIIVRGEVREHDVMISVSDQGVGIAPEDLARLFERFFRAKGLGQHVVGSGLGLPIARAIVESHGGRIWAESQLGQGSTFRFTLPMSRAQQGE